MLYEYRQATRVRRELSPEDHLCEALLLCQSILQRYKRTNTVLSSKEEREIYKLWQLLPAKEQQKNKLRNEEDTLEDILSYNGNDQYKNKIYEEKTINFLTKCDNPEIRQKVSVKKINEEMCKVLNCATVHTYSVLQNDNLLIDIVNGVASTIDASTAIGKSVEMNIEYVIGETMYIPVRVEGKYVGCIEAPGGRPSPQTQYEYQLLLKATGIVLRNMEWLQNISWEAQKSDAMLSMATRLARDTLDERVLIQSIMNTAKTLTESDRCSMFLILEDKSLEAHFEDGNVVNIPSGVGIAGYVARTGKVVNIPNAYEDERFNRDVDKATGYHTKTILCLPVMYEGNIVAVAQLINKLDLVTESGLHLPRTFGKRDEELFQTFSTFAAASLRNCRINDNLLNEKKKGDAILDVVTLLSNTDIRDVDSIVSHVLHGAKKLLSADRSSLFLLDKERNELYSRMADSVTGDEIRFPCGQGIAGTVAASAVGENIIDAYKDNRFNSSVDRKLNYRTQSLLCEPIVLNGEVLAVVQLVNKLDANGKVKAFSISDRETFRVFSLFAGISINNSHLLEFAVKAGREAMELNEKRYSVSFRSQKATSKNRNAIISDAERDCVLCINFVGTYDLMSIDFDLFGIREASKHPLDDAAAVVYQLLLGTGLPQNFGCRKETLLNFILQCRKKYRFVPYHNFFHVVDVCQTLHTYLYKGKTCELLTELECYVLLITALVHDLDHMGVNNSFYLKTDSPLGILSSASGNMSVLEVHHCNLAIEILSDPESDVFEGLEEVQARYAYKALIDCVLATDMAKHNEALRLFNEMCKRGFRKDDDCNRLQVMQMLMKAGDVSNVTKPFNTSRLWAMAVTEEFYRQGDIEKEKGVEVLPMFDRSRNNELAKGQIGFIDFVAGKFFKEIVENLFHGMQWCVDNIENNKSQWQAILDGRRSTSS